MRVGTWLLAVQYGFIGFGVLACGYCAWVWVGARRFQDGESRRLDEAMFLKHTSRGAGRVPRLSASDWGGLIGRLEIPRLGVSVMVVEGTADRDLRRAGGHIRGTAMPGGNGNMGIAGHRDTFFRPLHAIQRDDGIILRTLKGTYTYHVVSSDSRGARRCGGALADRAKRLDVSDLLSLHLCGFGAQAIHCSRRARDSGDAESPAECRKGERRLAQLMCRGSGTL